MEVRKALLAASGFSEIGMKQVRKLRVPILLYHSVSDHTASRFKKFTVSPGLFDEHMSYLRDQNYSLLTVSQYRDAIQDGTSELPSRPVLLTFDDGFTDFYANALPVLRRHGFAATLYVPTAFIGQTSRWLMREGESERSMLSWVQLIEACKNGIECGAHSHTHRQLDTLGVSDAREEVLRSKGILEERLGYSVSSFAYPYGYCTRGLLNIVRSAGFTSACAVGFSMSSTGGNCFALPRLLVTGDTSVDSLSSLLATGGSLTGRTFLRSRTWIWQVVRRSVAHLKRELGGMENSHEH